MTGRGRAVLLLGLFGAAGCHVGTRAKNLAPAKGPEGVKAAVDIRAGGTLEGELLAVADTGLFLLSDRRVTLVLARAVRYTRFAQFSELLSVEQDGRFADDESLRRVRLVSRFPQGLPPTLLQGLLSAYGQTQLDVVSQ